MSEAVAELPADETDALGDGEHPSGAGPQLAPYPPYVQEAEQRRRWDLCYGIIESLSAASEENGQPNQRMVWIGTRSLYFSDVSTGEAPRLVEAEDGLGESEFEATRLRAQELWQELEKAKPGEGATADDWWAHVARICDIYDELFGDPDDLPDADEVEEAAAIVGLHAKVPYNRAAHPKDRIGRWASKMGAMHKVAMKHPARLKHKAGMHVAAAALKAHTERAHKPGGALHGDLEKAHEIQVTNPAKVDRAELSKRINAAAQEQRNRQGARGARQQAVRARREAHGHATAAVTSAAMAAIHVNSKIEKNPAVGVTVGDPVHHSPDVLDDVDRAKYVGELAHEGAKYALEHADLVKAAAHAVHHLARSKGLTHSLLTDEERELEEAGLEPDEEAVAWVEGLSHAV